MAMPPPPVVENVEAAMLFARTARVSERYEDLVSAMEYVVRMTVGELTREQKMMVDIGYRIVMDAKRQARRNWEFIRLMEEEVDIPRNLVWSRHYINNVEAEMERICRDATHIIFSRVLFYHSSSRDKVYYHTMVGDLYRYRSEFKGDNWINSARVAFNEYQRAEEIAVRDNLPGNNYSRLLLACNFSTHCYLLSKPQRALAIIDTALDAALMNWPVLELDEYCMEIVNLLGKKRDAWFGPAIVVGGGINADGGEADQGQIHGGN